MISNSIGVVTEVLLTVSPALKFAMIALTVVLSPAALPLDDLSSWEPGEPIVLAAFVLLATGGAVVQYSLPAPEWIVRERSACGQCTFCARLPPRSGLIFVNLKLLCGCRLSLPFSRAPQTDQRRMPLSLRRLRQWAVVSTARAATRAANRAAFTTQTMLGWECRVRARQRACTCVARSRAHSSRPLVCMRARNVTRRTRTTQSAFHAFQCLSVVALAMA